MVDMDVAIIGLAVQMPKADGIEEFWRILKEGECCVREIPKRRKEDLEKYYQINNISIPEFMEAAYLDNVDLFDYDFFHLSPKDACLMDPNQRIFLETVWNALEDAGYGGDNIIGSNTGVFVGYCGEPEYRDMITHVEPEYKDISVIGNCTSVISGRISHMLNLKGPNLMINTVCSSSLVAVHEACLALKSGECDLAIAGGIQLHILPFRKVKVGVESHDGRTRTFDESSTGTGCGEGAGIVILKPLKEAIKDGDSIYAVIRGSAVNHDGHSVGISAPNPLAQAELISKALERARVKPDEISYIEAHGTGTRLGDPIEIEGIRKAFVNQTDKKQYCAIGSVKTNIGHLDGVAGIAGLIKAILCLKHHEIAPSLFYKNPNKNIDFTNSPVYVCDHLQEWKNEQSTRKCGVSSFGFSGTNCHVILEEYKEETQKTCKDNKSIFVLSALEQPALLQMTQNYINLLEHTEVGSLQDICYTVGIGRKHMRLRAAILADSTKELLNKLKVLLQRIMNNEPVAEDGIFYFGENKKIFEESEDMMEQCQHLLAEDMIDEKSLELIAKSYVGGAEIAWQTLYSHNKHNKVHLPTYAYQRKRCWLNYSSKEQTMSLIKASGREEGDYTSIEIDLAHIVGEILGYKDINIYDDFFDLGADSIVAMKVIDEVNQSMNFNLSFENIVQYSTIYDLALFIENKSSKSS